MYFNLINYKYFLISINNQKSIVVPKKEYNDNLISKDKYAEDLKFKEDL